MNHNKQNGPSPTPDDVFTTHFNNMNFKKPGNGNLKNGINKVIKLVGLAVVAVLAIHVVTSSVYHVSEQEQVVVTRFGKVCDVKTAGMYFRIPVIDSIHRVPTTTVGLPIGYRPTNPDIGEDGEAESVTNESLMITSDFNFVNTDFYLEYRVSDPIKYLYNSEDPEAILKNIAQSAIRARVSDFKVDDVMTTGKAQVQSEVKDLLIKDLTAADIGLEIVNLSIQDVEPPTANVMAAFKAVENAKQGSETSINNANKYQSEKLPAAEAEADRIVQNAEAKKEARIAEAQGQVARFNEMYSQYALNPLITKQRIFYETMENVLPGTKVIIDDGKTQTMLPLQPFNADFSANATSKTSIESAPKAENDTEKTAAGKTAEGGDGE
jgi:membrane protease subunit HflK